MRLIFIRHGEPDYKVDGLTQKGMRDAEVLAQRCKNWKVDRIYVSPMGRAVQTAEPTLKELGMEAVTMPWLREFSHHIINPTHGHQSVCWDYVPSDWTNKPEMFTQDAWLDQSPAVDNPELKLQYEATTKGIDEVLKEYGYVRKDKYYQNIKNPKNRQVTSTVIDFSSHYANELPDEDAGETVLFFCHFGVTCLMLAHLLNIPFEVLAHGTIIPTCGITIVNTEERWNDEVSFRIQALGDVAHLINAGENISSAGSFAPLFQG